MDNDERTTLGFNEGATLDIPPLIALFTLADSTPGSFLDRIEIWPFAETLMKMVLAVAAGTFVGLEREHRGKAGVRTFALTSLLGCMGGLLGGAFGFIAMLFVAFFVGLMNWREMLKDQQLALTTSVALTVVGFAGVMCGLGHVFTPLAACIITAAYLSLKEPISGFAVGLTPDEIRSAILLAIWACVIYPVLPDHPVDPWGLIDPRENWIAVIAIAAIGFANYILLKTLGPKGLELTAFFGGFVNSRKVIVELMSRVAAAGEELMSTARRGIVLATGSMVIRNALIVGIFAPQALSRCATTFLLMLLASVLMWWHAAQQDGNGPPPDIPITSPFKTIAVLKFGLLFLALNVAGTLAERYLGAASFYVVSVLGGLLSSASSITSAATLAGRGKIPIVTGANGIILSSITSAVANIALIITMTSNKELRFQGVFSLGLIGPSGLVGAALALTVHWMGTSTGWLPGIR